MDPVFSHLAVGIVGFFAGVGVIGWVATNKSANSIPANLKRHFSPTPLSELLITERRFPAHMRPDIYQSILSRLQDESFTIRRFTGVRTQYSYFGAMTLAELMDEDAVATAVAPQYEQVDVGDERPVRCVQNALWLVEKDRQRFALFASLSADGCSSPFYRVALATVDNAGGAQFAEELFETVESGVAQSSSYRGKILSFEPSDDYTGQAAGITVHQLRCVTREQVVLPPRTLELLERNVLEFVERRARLKKYHQAVKKGLLFYGPPGTGKTHTIHYLANALSDHTTLLISAEQVKFLSDYMTLARLLQPALVVLEDADLIARDREDMRNPVEEILLNKLLNEMDGMREDAEILFILTTNRPDKLEEALAARPGRVDQAIEFPTPDEVGRDKLVRLYAAGAKVSDEVVASVVAKTEHVSAAFIKELMRKAIQSHIARNGSDQLDSRDLEYALDELLFRGGSLNLKLLGVQSAATANHG